MPPPLLPLLKTPLQLLPLRKTLLQLPPLLLCQHCRSVTGPRSRLVAGTCQVWERGKKGTQT